MYLPEWTEMNCIETGLTLALHGIYISVGLLVMKLHLIALQLQYVHKWNE